MSTKNHAHDPDDKPSTGTRRKDTRRWCKGKPGRDHVPGEPVKGSYAASHDWPCSWHLSGVVGREPTPRYSCLHEVRCQTCGKILEHWLEPERCPDFQPYEAPRQDQ